jgi:hypothetical protein
MLVIPYCTALQQLAIRRRRTVLAAAAIALREAHAVNDAERQAFARRAIAYGPQALQGRCYR